MQRHDLISFLPKKRLFREKVRASLAKFKHKHCLRAFNKWHKSTSVLRSRMEVHSIALLYLRRVGSSCTIRRLRCAFSLLQKNVMKRRSLEQKFNLALRILSGRSNSRSIRRKERCFRMWISVVSDSRVASISSLKAQARNYKSSTIALKKQRALNFLSITVQSYVSNLTLSAFRRWSYFQQSSKALETKRALTLSIIVRMLKSRSTFRNFNRWRDAVFYLKKAEDEALQKNERVARLIRKKAYQHLALSFQKLQRENLVSAKLKSLRKEAARRLVSVVLSREGARVSWAFGSWCLRTNRLRIAHYERLSERVSIHPLNFICLQCFLLWARETADLNSARRNARQHRI